MVAGLNEAHLLDACLSSLDFCDEILYTDLGSSDESLQIARKYGARVFQNERVPSSEYVQSKRLADLKHEWFIFIDPDEHITEPLKQMLTAEFEQLQSQTQIGVVSVPWLFYIKGHQLQGTVWGDNRKYLLAHRDRFTIDPVTHYGRKLHADFLCRDIPLNAARSNFLHHNWMPGYRVFLRKHLRYLKKEGSDRYDLGLRMSREALWQVPLREFKHSYFERHGNLHGFLGLFLSAFWAYYQTHASLSLYHHQERIKREKERLKLQKKKASDKKKRKKKKTLAPAPDR